MKLKFFLAIVASAFLIAANVAIAKPGNRGYPNPGIHSPGNPKHGPNGYASPRGPHHP